MESLFYKKENGWKDSKTNREEVFAFCEKYKSFLNKTKTEREFVCEAQALAQANGFVPLEDKKSLSPGDKVYTINRKKGIMLVVVGSEDIEKGLNIIGAHLDSPRIDLKPKPLYEDSELALFKTHYYGGIKKYQWTTIPLAMHGTVVLQDGGSIDIAQGDEGGDISFTITDLLPHLAEEQSQKKLSKAIEGEDLNVLIGSIPLEGEEKEPVKAALLDILSKSYGMCEEDFLSAEIEFVPAFNYKDVGLDRSFVGGPGQDDRACAYTALKAILEIQNPKKTAVCLLVDKEEVGSMGVTGMQSRFFENTVAEICALLKPCYNDLALRRCLSASKCLSADVCAMHDPNYPSVMEKNNSAKAAHGVAIMKYTGSRGKGGSSDASAELMGEIRSLFNENDVLWQVTELGRVDLGGGGTIAQFVANLNIDTIDCGIPLFSMHSPYEVASKLDIFMAYKGYKAFFAASES